MDMQCLLFFYSTQSSLHKDSDKRKHNLGSVDNVFFFSFLCYKALPRRAVSKSDGKPFIQVNNLHPVLYALEHCAGPAAPEIPWLPGPRAGYGDYQAGSGLTMRASVRSATAK